MKLYLSIALILINCAVSTAQSYYFKGLDIDSGSNLVSKVTFDAKSKNSTLVSNTLLWHKVDSFNRFKTKTYFLKLDSNNNLTIKNQIEYPHTNFELFSNIKLKQGGYLAYGNQYNTKNQSQGLKGVQGCILYYSSNGDTIFHKLYPYGNNNATIKSVKQLQDSSIVLLSFLYNDSNTFTALRVIKLDTLFNTVFDSVYYYSLTANRNEPRISSYLDAVEETTDGGLIIGSSIRTRNAAIDYHGFYFKINSQGHRQWERKFEFARDSETEVNKVIKLKDGNYLLVGYYNDFWTDPNHVDFIFLLKINASGNILWSKFVKAYKYHYVFDALEKSNGELLLAGTFSIGINGFNYRAGLICLTADGNIKWNRIYTLPENMNVTEILYSELRDVEVATDGTLMSSGFIRVIQSTFPYNNGGNQDLIFLYTDSNGCVDPANCSFTTVEEEYALPYYLQAYPNPSNGLVKFSTNLPLASSTKIRIYNTLGQLMLMKERIDFIEELDLRSFPKGIYVLEIQSEEFRNTQKLIIE